MSEQQGKVVAGATEIERQYRVVDQLVSMHSMLRDRYERLGLALNTSLVGVSLVLCVMTFVGDQLLESAGQDAAVVRMVVGLVSAVILTLSITEFRVDWRGRAAQHADAARRLGELKAAYRRVRSGWKDDGEEGEGASQLTGLYESTLENVVKVPENMFNRLKARHLFKRILSAEMSAHPKAPYWFLWLRLRYNGMVGTGRVEEARRLVSGGGEDDD